MANTGYVIYTKRRKVVDGGIYDGQDLDINNQLCSVTGLPPVYQDVLPTDPDYKVLDTTRCPSGGYSPAWIIDETANYCEQADAPTNNYSFKIYEEVENSGFIIQIYAELRDEATNSPIPATVNINAEGHWINRDLSTSVETPVTEQLNLTAGNSRINLGTYDLSTNSCNGYYVDNINPPTMDGHTIIG